MATAALYLALWPLPAGGFPDPARRAGHYRDGAKLWARTHAASAAGCASGQQLRAGRTGKGGAGRRVSAFDYRLGGSATNDGGIGFARALGARFWRKDGTLLPAPAAGQDLAHIQRIDLSGLDPRLQQSEIQASCDVTNPLLGEHGATWVYGAQKGADEAALSELEGMAHYSQLLTQTLGFDVSGRPGAGAAGGMGAALIAYTGATLRPGIDWCWSCLTPTAIFAMPR